MDKAVDVFKGLADETRLQMLALLLRHGELCVCDFEQVLEITQSKASRHLRYLLHAGLLQDRREGVWVHYQIRNDLSPKMTKLLIAAAALLDGLGVEDISTRLNQWLERKARTGPPCRVKTAPKGDARLKS